MSVLGLLALVGIAAKVVSALLFNNARVVLISDSLLTGVYGLLLLGSVLIGKPVTVYHAACAVQLATEIPGRSVHVFESACAL